MVSQRPEALCIRFVALAAGDYECGVGMAFDHLEEGEDQAFLPLLLDDPRKIENHP